MNHWNKISLAKFQQIEAVKARRDIDEVDKVLFTTCIIFNLTEHQLNNAGVKKANKLISKVSKIFETEFKPEAKKRIGKYFINYDPSAMTFGQYVELSFFLNSPVQNAHYILASISNTLFRKNNSAHHRRKSEYFLHQPITKVTGSVTQIIENFKAFNKEYSVLFGLEKDVTGDVQQDPFNKRYGWTYSAEEVAKYERITLDQAYALPVRQALNDLAYLKAKSKYEAEQLKKK